MHVFSITNVLYGGLISRPSLFTCNDFVYGLKTLTQIILCEEKEPGNKAITLPMCMRAAIVQ